MPDLLPMLASSPSMLPISAVAGSHLDGVTGSCRCTRYRSSAARASEGRATLAALPPLPIRCSQWSPWPSVSIWPSLASTSSLTRKPGGVGEVQHEPQPLRGAQLPAAAPFEPLRHRLDGGPFPFAEHPHHRLPLRAVGTAHLEPGEWIGQRVALLDEPPVERAHHRQRIGHRSRRQVARETASSHWLCEVGPARPSAIAGTAAAGTRDRRSHPRPSAKTAPVRARARPTGSPARPPCGRRAGSLATRASTARR